MKRKNNNPPRLPNPHGKSPRWESPLLAGIQAADLQFDPELPLLVNQQTAQLLQLLAASSISFN